ncbi:C-GCAxxG-C-C family protein [Geobacter sp.]|uniref:C-GCAxxG-C-C family protein n=1 Tax=Geobacter sp. TaxID=46610 RepID=UPI002630B1B3|nr:C-GCAxxG-C-C family protein [Geobacter sp.]
MFWQKKDNPTAETVGEKVGMEAEGFYRSGKMHCAEAVFMAARNQFFDGMPEEIVRAAAGFGGGGGVGCVCGAVAGGTMAFGFALPDDKRRVKQLTKGLHDWFRHEYGAACCRVAMPNAKGRGGCAVLTGEVARKVAELMES